MKYLLVLIFCLFSTASFSESTIFLFNGNSPYSDPAKDFFDDLYKGVNGLNSVDRKVVFFPEQYESSLEYLTAYEASTITVDDQTLVVGTADFGGDFNFDFNFESALPELTKEEKQQADARLRLDYIYKMKHDAYADKDGLTAQVEQYLKEENMRGGEFRGDVTFYFTDHGSLRNNKPLNTQTHSFGAGEGELYPSDMVAYHEDIHRSFPEKKVVFIHDHCFSGGMLTSLWKNKETLEIHPNVCGFAAASPTQPSYSGETFMDMLSQISDFTDPEKIAAVDKDGDGKYSYGEGMDYYQSILHSGEMVGKAIPYSTKDTFLTAVFDKINTKKSNTKMDFVGGKCSGRQTSTIVDLSLINAPVSLLLAKGHVAKSKKALFEYLSFLKITNSENTLDDLKGMVKIEESKRLINEEELVILQDSYVNEKTKLAGYIADFYDISNPEAFYLELHEVLDGNAWANSEHVFKKINKIIHKNYSVLKDEKSSPSLVEFSKGFESYVERVNKYKKLNNKIDNFSTETTKYQRAIKEYKNLEGLKGIVSAMNSTDDDTSKWGRKRFDDYLSILECENSPFSEVKIVQNN